MVDEINKLLKMGIKPEQLMFYGLEYRYLTQYAIGQINYEEMFQKLNTAIHQFAKRQMTWFRRMEKKGIPGSLAGRHAADGRKSGTHPERNRPGLIPFLQYVTDLAANACQWLTAGCRPMGPQHDLFCRFHRRSGDYPFLAVGHALVGLLVSGIAVVLPHGTQDPDPLVQRRVGTAQVPYPLSLWL
jgi:hypothetical protein